MPTAVAYLTHKKPLFANDIQMAIAHQWSLHRPRHDLIVVV